MSTADKMTSTTHFVLIPSYNPGELVFNTVAQARRVWSPVWVVVDGSDDGTPQALLRLAEQDAGLKVIHLEENRGKGAAILHALNIAAAEGFSHALTMDSDGQHPAHLIRHFMRTSQRHPQAMILGKPVFDADAPKLRVQGRKISNFWANLETLGWGIDDSLYGFRVYPIAELRAIMQQQRWMRRFDFDPEAAVRLAWRGVPAINLPAPVKYLDKEGGGVSHFDYLRDNRLLTWMHIRLMIGFLIRLPRLIWRRLHLNPPT